MIGRLRQAGRRRAVLQWTLALVFAVAPALSLGLAAPSGSFVQAVVHSHDHGNAPHSHHHHSREHQRADAGANDGIVVDEGGQPGHSDGNRVHVHYDACCPSIIVPAPVALTFEERLSAAVVSPPVKMLRGSSPRRLLRPPIA